MAGLIRIHHQDGVAEYSVTSAEYGFIGNEFYLEIRAEPSTSHFLATFARLCTVALDGLAVGGSDISACLGREFILPTSRNDAEDGPDRFTNFYLSEHYDLDENHIRFSVENGKPTVEWRGTAPDVVYYDGRAKPNPIVIKCDITPGLFPPQVT